jgi:hypothetical protein
LSQISADEDGKFLIAEPVENVLVVKLTFGEDSEEEVVINTLDIVACYEGKRKF